MQTQNAKNLSDLGVMLDCSRGAVYRLSALKQFVDEIAEMGYTSLQLYSEDVYAVAEEPYFGYLRGRYSAEEIRELDAYAAERGVELIPCIQTLAHLSGIFRWDEYACCNDTDDTLLVGEERTYQLLDRLFAFCAQNFRSRNINIGMDEAHRLGLGKYLEKHGLRDRFSILRDHLIKVCAIAQKYGFQPMMWSDMFFSSANHGDYYGPAVPPSADELGIPSELKVIYWDYMRRGYDKYDALLKGHLQFGREVVFAGGAWAWFGFVPHNAYSIAAAREALRACSDNGVRRVFLALWKDDGSESSLWSALPTLFVAAEYYRGNFDDASVSAAFSERFGVTLEEFLCAEDADGRGGICNPSKYLFYADPFLGIFDRTVDEKYADVYKKTGQKLRKLCRGRFAEMFRTLADLCRFMEIKYALGYRVRKAYREGDGAALAALSEDFARAESRLRAFIKSFTAQWNKECKPFGFEKHDIRLGGLLQRLRHCRSRLREYTEGKTACIEELEEEILPFRKGQKDGEALDYNNWLFSSVIKPGL